VATQSRAFHLEFLGEARVGLQIPEIKPIVAKFGSNFTVVRFCFINYNWRR